jgi:hypothetical protein
MKSNNIKDMYCYNIYLNSDKDSRKKATLEVLGDERKD